jgi:hypothetical protein
MAYTPNATDATQPIDTVKAKTAAAEFRAIKAYLNSIVAAGLPAMAGNDGSILTVVAGAAAWRQPDAYFEHITFY